MIEILSTDEDLVLSSIYYTGRITYEEAIKKLVPLMNRFDAQRKLQSEKFYQRLRQDLLKGCIMPPITIAFVEKEKKIDDPNKYVNSKISEGYILDGLQRLNALKTICNDENFPKKKFMYLNIIISETQDKLLYRMITLNNGQKPMTPRHQIEILSRSFFNFDDLKNVVVKSEQAVLNSKKISFTWASLTKSYLAFLTNNVNNENSKIISEEMDKLIVNRIMERGVPDEKNTFYEIIKSVDSKCDREYIYEWFRNENNLIGFVAGIENNLNLFDELSSENFENNIYLFESGFKILNVSKIKVGQTRRELVQAYFKNFDTLKDVSEDDLKSFINENA